MGKKQMVDNGPMLNAYPDSIGENLGDMLAFLEEPEVEGVFSAFYILPSIFNTDLDRGFSVIDYSLNEAYAKPEDLQELKDLGIDLKLDFILNHASVLSKEFQDIIKNGERSKYKDFFINWNQFWFGRGEMTEYGYICPKQEYLEKMFFRKPGLPILMVRFPDGKEVPYWNTFYQEVKYPKVDAQDIMQITKLQYTLAERLAGIIDDGIRRRKKPNEINFGILEKYKTVVVEYLEAHRKYLGQMDLNIESPLVWEFYEKTLKKLKDYGARIVRLDAFAYAPKAPGEKNFLNEPGTWELLEKVRIIAEKYQLKLLPEIHASYKEKNYEKIAEKGYMTYDFFLPGLIIDALEYGSGKYLKLWAEELQRKKIRAVNMLGCHDGIPLLDLKGLIPEDHIQNLIDIVVSRGGYVKNLHGQKNIYYQVNATYYSALGEDDKKMLLARALQIFMPGKPQIWYLDLFSGKNDYDAVLKAGEGGHKEINRTNIQKEQIKEMLKTEHVQRQLRLLHFRNTFPAFGFDSNLSVLVKEGGYIKLIWDKEGYTATLEANLVEHSFCVYGKNSKNMEIFKMICNH